MQPLPNTILVKTLIYSVKDIVVSSYKSFGSQYIFSSYYGSLLLNNLLLEDQVHKITEFVVTYGIMDTEFSH